VSRLDTYRQYRDVGQDLNTDIFRTELNHDETMDSAAVLGIDTDGNEIHSDNEEQAVTHMDFALNDYRIDGQTAVERYRDAQAWDSEVERDILDQLVQAETSLFKITSVDPKESQLVLADLLNGGEEIELTDINYSKSATPGILLFFRLVPHEQFNMTSGVSMPFPSQVEDHLLSVLEQVDEKFTSRHGDVIRFRTFFEMYRKYGYNATYV
jgi:hypothetical protein